MDEAAEWTMEIFLQGGFDIEKSEKLNQMNISTFLTLLVLHMEIKPLLNEMQLAIGRGVVLVAENKHSADWIIRFLVRMGAKTGDHLNVNDLINSDTYIVIPTKKNSRKIISYLDSEVVPVLVCYGVPPEYLSGEYLIPVGCVDVSIDEALLESQIEEFRKYVHAFPELVVRELMIFRTSTWYKDHDSESILNIAFHAVLCIIKLFYRESHDEERTENVIGTIETVITHYVNQAEEYGEYVDIVEPIRKLLIAHMDSNDGIIGDVDEVDGALAEALKRDQAILYDADWYFIPEKLFHSICEPILDFISMPEIKRNLLEEGYLCCNSNLEKCNFTIKKVFTNVYGVSMRVRFLKVNKEIVTGEGGLGLEERRGTACILEKRMDKSMPPEETLLMSQY